MPANIPVSPELALDAVRTILRYIGEDPAREGLKETPARVLRAWSEFTSGYAVDVPAILSKSFECDSDEMVVVRDIPFVSHCEHHMVAFVGVAHVGYLPASGRVVGLSKIARVVQAFAKRLQIQERMTREIAEAISEHLNADGVGVRVSAVHQCMAHRGVKAHGASTVTTSLLGEFRRDPAVRAEFLDALKG